MARPDAENKWFKGLVPNKIFTPHPKEVITEIITEGLWKECKRPKTERRGAEYILLSMALSWRS